jgi:hypothetical protein
MTTTQYETRGQIRVHRTVEAIPLTDAIAPVVHTLDTHRGVLLASNYEYPGRYTRWDMGFVDPPLVIVARGRSFRVEALNPRGRVLLPPIADALRTLAAVRAALPDVLRVTAETEDGVVMAVEHATLPLAAVQFHPESIMTLGEDVGLRLLANVMHRLARTP